MCYQCNHQLLLPREHRWILYKIRTCGSGWHSGKLIYFPGLFWSNLMTRQDNLFSPTANFRCLWCCCGPGSFFIVLFLGVGVWIQSTLSFTITHIWFLLINYPMILWIYMMVICMVWETRVDIWIRVDVFPIHYVMFPHMFQWKIWFFQCIIGITFSWGYMLWRVFSLLVCIGCWGKMSIYTIPPDPIKWSFWGFLCTSKAFMMIWLIHSKKFISVSQQKECYETSDVRLETALMAFEFHTCLKYKGIENPK